TPSDVFPLHKSFSPSLGGQDIRSPFLAAGVSAGTGTPGSARKARLCYASLIKNLIR
ncbi:hypothetical protein Pmar_PMAR002561, partial [Perkinsus marinus ATCC 50983]